MCSCKQPTINGQICYQWQPDDKPRAYPVNPPQMNDGDELLADEPGRCGRKVDSHCHHFCIVKRYYQIFLLVRNGGGDKAFKLRDEIAKTILNATSEDRYWLIQSIYHTLSDATREAVQEERYSWRQAIAENRVKKRKVRNTNRVDVWVLNPDSGRPLSRSF